MTFTRTCDGCHTTKPAGPLVAGWVQLALHDEQGETGNDCVIAHACSWQCVVTLAMDGEELFPGVVRGEVEA